MKYNKMMPFLFKKIICVQSSYKKIYL